MDTNGNLKQLLLKDLCGRLPYGVKVQVCNATEYTPILKGILGDDLFLQFDYFTKPIKNGDSTYNLIEDNIKPYLRPMSSMTEDEFAELSNIISDWFNKEWFYLTEGPFLEYALSKINYSISPQLFDWLNAHHFDYRNFIKRGLALPAPEGMYNF